MGRIFAKTQHLNLETTQTFSEYPKCRGEITGVGAEIFSIIQTMSKKCVENN